MEILPHRKSRFVSQPAQNSPQRHKEHQEEKRTLSVTHNVCLLLCDLCVFVVNLAVFRSVRRCHMAHRCGPQRPASPKVHSPDCPGGFGYLCGGFSVKGCSLELST